MYSVRRSNKKPHEEAPASPTVRSSLDGVFWSCIGSGPKRASSTTGIIKASVTFINQSKRKKRERERGEKESLPKELRPRHRLIARSEEHTSELQSPDHLVCR